MTIGKTLNNKDGYTSFDVLVALTVVSVLSAAVAPSVVGVSNRAKLERALNDIKTIEFSINLYQAKFGKFPTQAQGLSALITNSSRAPSLQIYDDIPLDPWGNQYIYLFPGTKSSYDIISYGADGRPGGDGLNSDLVGSQVVK